MTILQKTKSRYESTDKGKPLPAWGSVRYPRCLVCGGMVIPCFDDKRGKCPTCGRVNYVMVAEDALDAFVVEIKNKKAGPA